MSLGFSEVRRAKLRFGLLTAAVSLLVFLVLLLTTLAGALVGSLTGALEGLQAQGLAYSAAARDNIAASRLDPSTVDAVAAVPGVAATGAVGTFTTRADLAGTPEDAQVFGFEPGAPGAPGGLSDGRLPEADGEAAVDGGGVEIGDTVTLQPTGIELEVVGLLRGAQFNAIPTAYVTLGSYEQALTAANPGIPFVPVNAVAFDVAADADVEQVAAAVTDTVPDVIGYARADAVAKIPGISSITQSFGILVGLTFIIGIVVIGFFFLILTVQKLRSFTLLRAIGAPTRSLAGTVALQITLVVLVASLIAVGLTLLAVQGLNTGIPVQLDPVLIITTVLAVLVFSLLAGLLSIRRISRIDPATAVGGTLMLATREIQRGKGRFASIVAALSLIVFLVLVLGALADGLFFGATGAVRSTTATAYVFSSDAEGSLVRSRLDASDVAPVAEVPGVTSASPVGVLLTGGTGPEGAIDLAVFGLDMGAAGTPTTLVEGRLPEPGEDGVAAVDTRLRDAGVKVGSPIAVGDVSATVVGFVSDASYQLQPTAWTSVATWRAMRDAVRPELRGQPTAINAIAVATEGSPDLAALAAAVPDTSALTAEQTGLAIPGVEQQSSTLNSIIYTTLAVAGLVVALFFALLVLEKRELFAALKALGSSTGRLGRGVIVQAFIASVLGVVFGAVLARLFGLVIPPEVPTLFRTETLVTIAVFTVVAGVVGALFSLRRIARIDPATAIGGAL